MLDQCGGYGDGQDTLVPENAKLVAAEVTEPVGRGLVEFLVDRRIGGSEVAAADASRPGCSSVAAVGGQQLPQNSERVPEDETVGMEHWHGSSPAC